MLKAADIPVAAVQSKPAVAVVVPVAVPPVHRPPPVHARPTAEGWYWQQDDSSWQRFEQTISDSATRTLKSGDNTNTSVSFNHNGNSYSIDTRAMIQTNLTTGKQRRVTRVSTKHGTLTRARSSTASKYLWFWQKLDDGRWEPFGQELSDIIDAQFIQNATSKLDLQTLEIDLANNVLQGKEKDTTCPIIRVQSHRSLPISRSSPRNSIWQVKADDGCWIDFHSGPLGNSVSSDAVMTAWMNNRSSNMVFHAQNYMYVIDFARMTQTNETTGKVRSIQLKQVVGDKSVPSTWDLSQDMVCLPLQSTSNEYKDVVGLFAKTMPNIPVKCVKRIQNRALYQPFHVYKTQLEARLGRGNGVWDLFHGTKAERINDICKQGFDSRLHTKYRYGKGSYFARDSSYSARYTDCNTMFMAEVKIVKIIS